MLLEWYDSQMLLSAQQACVLMLACVRKPSQGENDMCPKMGISAPLESTRQAGRLSNSWSSH